jgi:hypothetical protein
MIHWYNAVGSAIIVLLIVLIFKDYSEGGGSYMDLSGLINFFWFLVLLLFVAIWGGIFWW